MYLIHLSSNEIKSSTNLLEHIKGSFNVIKIFSLNKIEYPCLIKEEIKIIFNARDE